MNARSPKFVAWALSCVLALVAAGVFVLIDDHLQKEAWDVEQSRLRAEVQLLKDSLGADLGKIPEDELQQRTVAVARFLAIRITLINGDGTVLADSESNPRVMDNLASRPELIAALSEDFGTCHRMSPTLGINALFVAAAVRRDGQHAGWIRASISDHAVVASTRGMESILMIAIAAVACISAVVGAVWTNVLIQRKRAAAG